MGFPILVRCHLYIESGPSLLTGRRSLSQGFPTVLYVESIILVQLLALSSTQHYSLVWPPSWRRRICLTIILFVWQDQQCEVAHCLMKTTTEGHQVDMMEQGEAGMRLNTTLINEILVGGGVKLFPWSLMLTWFPEHKSSLLWNFNFKFHMHVDGIGRTYWFSAMSLSKWPPGGHIGFFGFRTLTLLRLWISTSNLAQYLCIWVGAYWFSNVIFKMAACHIRFFGFWTL